MLNKPSACQSVYTHLAGEQNNFYLQLLLHKSFYFNVIIHILINSQEVSYTRFKKKKKKAVLSGTLRS